MHTETATRRPGRLSREDQRRLGDILKRVYDDVIQQGVPGRFKDLLEGLETAEGGTTSQTGLHGRGSGEEASRVAEASARDDQGLDRNKGSH